MTEGESYEDITGQLPDQSQRSIGKQGVAETRRILAERLPLLQHWVAEQIELHGGCRFQPSQPGCYGDDGWVVVDRETNRYVVTGLGGAAAFERAAEMNAEETE